MRYNGYNVPMLRRLPLLAALACALALTQLGGALGAFPGSNGVIAYTCNAGADVCKVNPDGTGGGTIMASATHPGWAGQGVNKIAYVKATGIVVATTDSSGAVVSEQSVPGTSGATAPALSPNGTQVAYILGSDLWTNNTNGSAAPVQQTNTATIVEAAPDWSPDGSQIAYSSKPVGQVAQLCVLTVSSGGVECIINATAGDDNNPNWSPDGSKLVFDSTRAGVTPTLYTVNAADGSGLAQLGGGIQGTDPAYSPDGTTIVYVNTTGSLSTVTSSGASATAIPNTNVGTQPDWQPLPPPPPPPPPSPTPPKNVSYPTIILPFGRTQPLVGDTLFATTGSWSGQTPMTFTYQWKRCNPPGNFGSCFDIPKQTSSFYTLTEDDYGDSIRVLVTATNSLGTASQNSEASPAVTEIAPHARVTPPIVGQNVEGQTLSVGTGTWDGTALTFTYEWRRCNPMGDFSSCVAIKGATSSTYIQTADDIGLTLRVWITAKNKAGTDFTITNHTYPTIPKPHFAPASTITPPVTGPASVGEVLTAGTGTWSGDLPITYTYAWQRCDATGSACRSLLGQTRRKYTVTSRDVGYTLRVLVTATNAYGKSSAMSQATDTIPAVPKHHRGRRIVGTPGNDYLAGGPYDDVIYGLAGNDTIHGGAGYDVLYGGPGNDILDGGPGRDRIYGGPGSDTILAADNERDFIDCGPGNDRAVVDAIDVVKNCEQVDVVGQTPSPAPVGP